MLQNIWEFIPKQIILAQNTKDQNQLFATMYYVNIVSQKHDHDILSKWSYLYEVVFMSSDYHLFSVLPEVEDKRRLDLFILWAISVLRKFNIVREELFVKLILV